MLLLILTHKCVIIGLDTITVNFKKSFPIIYILKQIFYSKSTQNLLKNDVSHDKNM